MSSIAEAFGEKPATTATGETLDSYIRQITKFGRLGETVTFDPPGLKPVQLHYEVLDDEEEEKALEAAYKYTVKKLGAELRGPVEDTKLYDCRLLKEKLYLAVKNPNLFNEQDGVKFYYPAALSADEFGKFTPEQQTLMFNQYLLVQAKYTPSKAQQLLMSGVENLAAKCAEAINSNQDENRFLFLASLSWSDAIMLVGTLGAHLHDFLAPSTTQSSSPDTSESTPPTSDTPTDSSTESQLHTSNLLDRSTALLLATSQPPDSSPSLPSNPTTETVTLDPQPNSDKAATDLANLLKT